MAEGVNADMLAVAITETGNEFGLSPEALADLSSTERAARGASAEKRLRSAGAHAVLKNVGELPAWLEARAMDGTP